MSKVIDALNKLLRWELTSIDQYTRNAALYEDWGLTKLHARIAHEADDERGHAKMLIDRILLLGGNPDLESRHSLPPCPDVPTMLKGDLELELQKRNGFKGFYSALRSRARLCKPSDVSFYLKRYRGRPCLLVETTAWLD